MIVAITGTPGTGKTEVAKALSKRLGWKAVSLNDLAEKKDLYRGFDDERMVKIVDMAKMRQEVGALTEAGGNLIIESHYAHDMAADVVIVLRTDPEVLRERMTKKGFHTEKIAENMEAEMMEIIRDEAVESHKNVFEIDTTRKTPEAAAKEIEAIVKSQHFLARDLVVPEDLLMDFRRPFGRVYRGPEDEAAESATRDLKGKRPVVAVGDSTSYYLIKHGIRPDMIIIDGMERRRKFGRRISFRAAVVKAKNPPRRITADLWKAVEDSVKRIAGGKTRVKIIVKGEEDLAVLPCAIHLPLGSRIAYGHFGEGLVVVTLDPDRKQRAKALLENIMFSQ